MNSYHVILQFAPKVFDGFLLLEMREEPVEKKQSSPPARNGTAQAGQIVQLPERAGKGCFSALIRSGNIQKIQTGRP